MPAKTEYRIRRSFDEYDGIVYEVDRKERRTFLDACSWFRPEYSFTGYSFADLTGAREHTGWGDIIAVFCGAGLGKDASQGER